MTPDADGWLTGSQPPGSASPRLQRGFVHARYQVIFHRQRARRRPVDRRLRARFGIRRHNADGRPRPGFELCRAERCVRRQHRQRSGRPHTTLRGDLGVKANAQPTGFPPGVVTGMTRVGTAADQAHADLVAAYTEVAARTGGAPLAGALAGATISPGLHSIGRAASNTGTVTLDGGGRPERGLRHPGQWRPGLRRRQPRGPDRRRPGVPSVLAGQRRRSARRQRQFRGHADGHGRGRRWAPAASSTGAHLPVTEP